jgi:hypothetical protein
MVYPLPIKMVIWLIWGMVYYCFTIYYWGWLQNPAPDLMVETNDLGNFVAGAI